MSSTGVELITGYFPNLSSHQRDRYAKLSSLYSDWNEKINVISRKDIDQLYLRHVLHSLGIAKVIEFLPKAKVLDVGTGGGFPGIPLAIMFPETDFHLVDSIGKKITVVKEVAESLGLKNVRAEQARAETMTRQYDFVVSRAVTRLKEFYGWIHKGISKKSGHELQNGILYLKGGDLQEELKELNRRHKLFPLSDHFNEEFFETKVVVHVAI